MIQFNFAWAKEDENFDPIKHSKMDLDIFKFSLIHEEGAFAEARVWLKSPILQKKEFFDQCKQNKIFISLSNNKSIELLFCGRFILAPHKIEGDLLEFTLTSRPFSAETLLEDLHQRMVSDLKMYNPLFTSAEAERDVSLSLEGTTKIHYWCPKTHQLSLSDIFKGSTHYEVEGNIMDRSLQTRFVQVPIEQLAVTVKVRWLQEQRGCLPLTSRLRQLGVLGNITSLTGRDLKHRWWKQGQKLHKANYWVEESSLEEVTSIFNHKAQMRHVTSPISLSPLDPLSHQGQQTKVRLKVRSYTPKLTLGWKVRQLRDESLKFVLTQRLQQTNVHPNVTRDIIFHVHRPSRHDLVKPWHSSKSYNTGDRVLHDGFIYKCNFPHRAGHTFQHYQELFDRYAVAPSVPFRKLSSFFHSNHGYETFDHAVRRAASHLLSSARAIEVSFKTTINLAHLMSCDTSLTVFHPSVPGGKVVGKIKRFNIVVDGDSGESYISVVLGVSIAAKSEEVDRVQNSRDTYVFDSYCTPEEDAPYTSNRRDTAYGLSHVCWDDQRPAHHFGDDAERDAVGLLDAVIIKNQAQEQEAYIHEERTTGNRSLAAILKECRTSLELKLHALKPFSHKSHEIVVSLLEPLNAPHQIDL